MFKKILSNILGKNGLRLFWANFFLIILSGVAWRELFFETKSHLFLTYIMLSIVCFSLFKYWMKIPKYLHAFLHRLFCKICPHISKKCCFDFSNNYVERFFLGSLFVALCSALSVLASRCYFDISFGGSWIRHFAIQFHRVGMPIHRFMDFICHFLPVLALFSIFFFYYEEIRDFCTRSSKTFLFWPFFVPLLAFLIWTHYYDLASVYYVFNAQAWHIVIIIICVGTFMILPLQLFLSNCQFSSHITNFYKIAFFLLSSSYLIFGLLIFKTNFLLVNLMVWSSFFTFILSCFLIFSPFKKFILGLAAFCSTFVYSSFFITEIYLWSAGGSDSLFYTMVNPAWHANAKELYFIHKSIFYISILYSVSLTYIHFLKNGALFPSRLYVGSLFVIELLVFFFWSCLKGHQNYDILFTVHDHLFICSIIFIFSWFFYRPLLININKKLIDS